MMINQKYKMKFVLIIAIIVNFNSILAQCEDGEYSTIGVLDDINEEIYNDDESVNAYSIFNWTSDLSLIHISEPTRLR